MTDFLEGFLGGEAEPLPTTEGFVSGFIGPVTAARLWKFWSADDLDDFKADLPKGATYKKRTTRGGSHFYYFENQEHAAKGADLLGEPYPPNQCWRFETPTSQVLNLAIDNAESVWGNVVGGDVRVATMRSKYRHEFHMIALPTIVNAAAQVMGFLKESAFDLSELLGGDVIFDDGFQEEMIGSPDATDQDLTSFNEAVQVAVEMDVPHSINMIRQLVLGDDEAKESAPKVVLEAARQVNHVHPQHSVLFQQRATLWWALGEDNPLVYNATDAGTKYDTTSDMLNTCLQVVTRVWEKPVWGRLVLVPDPRVDAVYGEGKRLSVPALTAIYATEAEAQAAAEEAGVAPAKSTAKDDGDLPSEWAGYAKEWRAEIKKHKDSADGKLPPMPKRVKLAKELSCTVEELASWWGRV